MFRQPLVEEGVIAVDHLHHTAVFAHEVAEKHLGLLAHGAAQGTIEFDGGTVEPAPAFFDQLVAFAFLLGSED